MNPSDRAVMSMRETHYAISGLKAGQAQDKAVEERTSGKTKDFREYCKTTGMFVPTRTVFDHEGYTEEERAQRKKRVEEAVTTKEGQINLERNGSRKRKQKHTRQR